MGRPTEPRHHMRASQRFAKMLLQMRAQGNGGLGFSQGMRHLFHLGPRGARQRAEGGPLADLDTLQKIADEDFFRFERLANHVTEVVESAKKSGDVADYTCYSKVMEAEVMAATENTRASGELFDHDWMAQFLYALKWQKTGRMLSPGELFVHLPLTMYVQNTLHLYEMLARLNSKVARGVPEATKPQSDFESGPFSLRLQKVLDQRGQPYSWLVYAIVAALQILYRARTKMSRSSKMDYPFALLASNPGSSCGKSKKEPDDNGLMFRGLWVPPDIDEDRLHFLYSFNSWSRSLGGVLFVLDFYAKVLPVAQTKDWHVLILVSHGWRENPWVMPVQFFGGPAVGDAEKELIVPPFMTFAFEADLSLQSEMPMKEIRHRAHLLEERWGLKGDLLTPELRELLDRKPGLLTTNPSEESSGREGPRVTVRFVADMEPRLAIKELFENDEQQLLAFPPFREAQ